MGKTKTPAAAAATPAPSPTPAVAPAQPWAKTEGAENPTPDANAATDAPAPVVDAKNPAATGNGAGSEGDGPVLNDQTGDGTQQPTADPEATPGPETPKFDEEGNELVTADNKSNPTDHTPKTAGDPGGFENDAAEVSRQNLAAEAAARQREVELNDQGEVVQDEVETERPNFEEEEAGLYGRVDSLEPDDQDEFRRSMLEHAKATLARLERGAEARSMVLNFVEPGTHFGTLAVDALAEQQAAVDEDNGDD